MASAALPEAIEPGKKGNVKFALGCAILASTMTCILVGYDMGVMSGASLYIQKDLRITDVQLEILMGILNVYSLLGSFAAGRTSDWIGRRYSILFTAVILLAGAFLMGFAVNYGTLMFGNVVAGVGVGYALMVAPVYTAELSPVSARGLLTSLPEIFFNLGVLLAYVSNYAFSRLPLRLGWRVMLGIGAAPSVVLALMVLLGMPESPQWLVMKGRLADAKVVLGKTSDTPEEAAERLADIKAAAGIPQELDGDVVTVPKKQSNGEARVWKQLILSPTPAMRRILLAGLGIHFFQQASGLDAVVLYSPRVFKAAGIASDNRLLGTTCAVGVTKTVFVLVATFLLDRVGRRPLLLSSVGGMIVSLLGLAAGLTVIERHPDAKIPWAIGAAIASTMASVAFFSIGVDPITWVYSSEVFPLHVRALGCALGIVCNRVTSAVISMTFISLTKAITIGGAFFLYAGVAVLAWVFFFTFLPETRGRTLEVMTELFGATNDELKPQHDGATTKDKKLEMAATN